MLAGLKVGDLVRLDLRAATEADVAERDAHKTA